MSSLLLISAIPEDVAFATEVASRAGCKLIHTANIKDGVNLFKEATPQFLFADGSSAELYKELETKLHDSVGLFSDLIQPNMIHFISSETLDSLPYLTMSPIFGHLIYRKFNKIEESASLYSRILVATQRERAYGLESFLRTGTKIQTIKLASSDHKQSAVAAVMTYLLQAKFQPRMATLIGNAVDEILMNAMFDAPVDNAGRHLLSATPRSTVLKLDGRSAVEMQIGFDGQYVGVTAIDHFGSVDKAKLLAHTSKNYSETDYSIKTNQAGAGLGLATIYQNGGSFFFASGVGDRTEATIFFKRTDSFVEFRNQFRFFSTQFYF